MTAVTPGSAEVLALANKVEKDIACTRTYSMREWSIIEDALRLAAKPAEDGRETAIEECAKIVDAECERILSKQTLTTAGDLVTQNAVNANLRMIACFLPELSAAIRALSTTGEPKR